MARYFALFCLIAFGCKSRDGAGPGGVISELHQNTTVAAEDPLTFSASWRSRCEYFDLGSPRLGDLENCPQDPFEIEVTCSLSSCVPVVERANEDKDAHVRIDFPAVAAATDVVITVRMHPRNDSSQRVTREIARRVVPVENYEIVCFLSGRRPETETDCAALWQVTRGTLLDSDPQTYPTLGIVLVGLAQAGERIPVAGVFLDTNGRPAESRIGGLGSPGVACVDPRRSEGSAIALRYACFTATDPGRIRIQHRSFSQELILPAP